MKRPLVLLLGLAALLVGTSCQSNLYSSLVNRRAGMNGVEGLLSWIERVRVDTELSKESAGAALDALLEMVSQDFSGDPLVAYADYVAAIDACDAQAAQLGADVEKMKRSAQVVFEAWAADLETFASTEMRLRSHERMDKTKERYRDLVLKVEPAYGDLVAFNTTLRDHALYLGHDFNAGSVASIEPELRKLGLMASDLAKQLQASLDSANAYIELSALPGVPGSAEETAETPTATQP